MMMSWENPRIPRKGIKEQSELLNQTEQLRTMVSEVFLAIFHACFNACYDMSNESCLRWWINENIRDFIAPTFICSDPPQVCTVQHEGHRPKVLLWIMEEFFYISHDLMEEDHDGHVILNYELMMEAEHQFRIKWVGAFGIATPHHLLALPHSAVERHWNALPGVSQTAKHWSTWYGQCMMDCFHQGPHRNLWALSLITK